MLREAAIAHTLAIITHLFLALVLILKKKCQSQVPVNVRTGNLIRIECVHHLRVS